MTDNPFAALLAGVYVYEDGSVDYEAVLAALAAAVSDDLAEAGKVLAKLQSQIGDDVQDVYLPGALHKLSADTITALLARIAAQEAQIKGLEAENRDMVSLSLMLTDANNRAEAAETTLAAERAKVARLVEALTNLPAVYAHQINTGVREVYDPLQRFYTMESVLTAINEAQK